jgi:protein Cut8
MAISHKGLPTVRTNSPPMASRKRKADDDGHDQDERMTSSPSPSMSTGVLPQQRNVKKLRTNVVGRPLTLPRLLETYSADQMRGLLQRICERYPEVGTDIVQAGPRPTVQSALEVLERYERNLQASFPLGARDGDYAFNRIRTALSEVLDALKDFTPHFLPPNETQHTTSLSFLDGATEIIHRLPEFRNFQNNRLKQDAYEEMAKAWTLVVREAAKRAGGMQLHHGNWDQKLLSHNEKSQGRMQEAVDEMRNNLGWMGGETGGSTGGVNDSQSIGQQLLNGTYFNGVPVRVGPW